MITVSILINGEPIFTRSATNITEPLSKQLKEGAWNNYKVDTGEIMRHKRSDGAVVLAHKLLDTIKE